MDEYLDEVAYQAKKKELFLNLWIKINNNNNNRHVVNA